MTAYARILMILIVLLSLMLSKSSSAQTTSSKPPSEEEIVIRELTKKNRTLQDLLLEESDLKLIEQGRRMQLEVERDRHLKEQARLAFEAGERAEAARVEEAWLRRVRWFFLGAGVVLGAGAVGGAWWIIERTSTTSLHSSTIAFPNT